MSSHQATQGANEDGRRCLIQWFQINAYLQSCELFHRHCRERGRPRSYRPTTSTTLEKVDNSIHKMAKDLRVSKDALQNIAQKKVAQRREFHCWAARNRLKGQQKTVTARILCRSLFPVSVIVWTGISMTQTWQKHKDLNDRNIKINSVFLHSTLCMEGFTLQKGWELNTRHPTVNGRICSC